MRNITEGPLFLIFLLFILPSSASQLTGYSFRDELAEVEHILFLTDLKNIAPFTRITNQDLLYLPPQDFFYIIHEKHYMIFAKSFKKEEEKSETQQDSNIQALTLNDIPSLNQRLDWEKQNYRVRVVEEDFTRDQNGMLYFQGFKYKVDPQEEIKVTSLLVQKIRSAPVLIESQKIINSEKTDLVTSFKTNSIHIIYIASGSLCSDSAFTKSKTKEDYIGANRRFCRELIHWLMEEDPLEQKHKFEELDTQLKVGLGQAQIHKRRNILSLPKMPIYFEIWVIILLFFWFILKFIYSDHKDWVRQDKLKDKKPEEPMPSFQEYQEGKKRKSMDGVKPRRSQVKDARKRINANDKAVNESGEL